MINGPFVRVYEQSDSHALINLDHLRRADCGNLKEPLEERRVGLTYTDGTVIELQGMDAERVISALDERTSHPNPRRR